MPRRAPNTARLVAGVLLGAAVAPGWTGEARGQAVPPGAADIGTAKTSGSGGDQSLDVTPASGTAADVAPSRAPLSAAEPTSIVGKTFINNSVTPTENYDDIIKFSPSVQNVEPAGAGLQQNFAETIRGFNYTQFNTVFDGIVLPGLPTNFAPLSAAYITAHDIGSVQIDRGPGTASTIGYATFGGTVSILSKSPTDTVQYNPYTTFGSWGTVLGGMELDTGRIDQLNGARAMIDVSHESGNGPLSGISTTRNNLFSKIELPIGDNTLVTIVALLDDEHTNTPYGATLAEIAKGGPGYGLDNNPLSQNYKDYNYDKYATDFFYTRVKSDLGHGFTFDDVVYTSGYYQHGLRGVDESGIGPNVFGTVYSNGQRLSVFDAAPVLRKHNDFRDYGDILRLSKDTDYGQIRAGVLVDDLQATSYRYGELPNDGSIIYSTKATSTPYSYNYQDGLVTYQPYIEMGVKPLPKTLPGLVITPGVKYTSTTRSLDAAINSSTKLPADFSVTYAKPQPSIDARYTIANGWVAYAQVARGFLAPPINSLYTASAPPALSPEETTNYQTGMTFQRDWLTVTGDAYYIPFSNLIVGETVPTGTLYANAGGAIYKGLEAEGTVRVGYGVAFYGNYSINDGNYRGNNQPIQLTPRTTAAAGVIYQRDNVFIDNTRLFGSIIGKFIGPQWLQNNISGTPGGPTTVTNVYPISAYSFADAAIGYTFPVWEQKKITAKLNVNNIFDNRSLIGLGAVASDGITPLYFVDPGRSFFISLSATL